MLLLISLIFKKMYLKVVATTERVFGFKRLEVIQEIQKEFQALNFLQID